MDKKQVEFPKYADLSEEERQRLLDTVNAGILQAQREQAGAFVYVGETDEADGLEVGFVTPPVENQPHVLETTETEPGVFTHRIVYGRRRFERAH